MDDAQSLRGELEKLRRRLEQIEGVPEEQAVDELIGDGVGAESRGFAAAVAVSNADALENLEAEAVRYLRSGVNLKGPTAHQAFFNRFGGPSGLGFSKLSELIRKYSPR